MLKQIIIYLALLERDDFTELCEHTKEDKIALREFYKALYQEDPDLKKFMYQKKWCAKRKGLTWGKFEDTDETKELGVDLVGYYGEPITDKAKKKKPKENGNTDCTETLPILCINISQKFLRPPYSPIDCPDCPLGEYYNSGWTGGLIRLTEPINGCDI